MHGFAVLDVATVRVPAFVVAGRFPMTKWSLAWSRCTRRVEQHLLDPLNRRGRPRNFNSVAAVVLPSAKFVAGVDSGRLRRGPHHHSTRHGPPVQTRPSPLQAMAGVERGLDLVDVLTPASRR